MLGRPEHCRLLVQVKTNTHVILFPPNSVWCRHHVVSKGLDSLCSTKSPRIGGRGRPYCRVGWPECLDSPDRMPVAVPRIELSGGCQMGERWSHLKGACLCLLQLPAAAWGFSEQQRSDLSHTHSEAAWPLLSAHVSARGRPRGVWAVSLLPRLASLRGCFGLHVRYPFRANLCVFSGWL